MKFEKMNNRHILQRYITAAVINENAYPLVKDIISFTNMRDIDNFPYIQVWKAFSVLYPHNPIDLVTIHNCLIDQKGTKINFGDLVEITNSIGTATNAEHHAFCLVELDAHEKLLADLESTANTYLQEENIMASVQIRDIYKHYTKNSFDLIIDTENIKKYVYSKELDKCYFIDDYLQAIKEKATRVQQNAQINTLSNYLNIIALHNNRIDNYAKKLLQFSLKVIKDKKVELHTLPHITALINEIE